MYMPASFTFTSIAYLVGILDYLPSSAEAAGVQRVVDSNGGGQFTTIQAAIDAADVGDTILVKKHVGATKFGWQGSIRVNKNNLKIVGQGPSEPLFDVATIPNKSQPANNRQIIEDFASSSGFLKEHKLFVLLRF